MQHLYALILAGGRGTRFWPRSRRAAAKQVLRLFGDRSLIQQTVQRLRPLLPPENIWVLTNPHLHAGIVRQLPEIPRRQILAEPAQRNTAPAIGLAAQILHGLDPDATLGVFPADHFIARPDAFLSLLQRAFRAARQGNIVVLGIQPRWPETGYGYIEFPKGVRPGGRSPLPVRSFREKPDTATAARFLRAGNYYWNAGMFFGKTAVLLEALRTHLPRTASLLAALPRFGQRGFAAALARAFPKCENISFDYAVLERASNVAGLPAAGIGWNDVGSWNAVYELHRRDRYGNVLRSPAILQASSGNFADAGPKLVALLGVENLIIVDTPDALLVAARERAQQVGGLVRLLEKAGHRHLL